MRTDDIPLQPDAARRPEVRREPLMLGSAEQPLFGWYHVADAVPRRDAVVVICNPMGYEYAHGHRSLRHLADDLARSGVPALRFDYHGTGDSPGLETDAGRLQRWQDDVHAAIAAAQSLSGSARVGLLGVRLGATLAALVAAQREVDWLVLWNVCASGRRHVREMQALDMAAGGGQRPVSAPLEPAGFLMSRETQEAVKAVQLTREALRVSGRALLVARDDLIGEEDALREHLLTLGIATDAIACAGYADMMAEPVHTVVPRQALDSIVQWMVAQTAPREAAVPLLPSPEGATQARFTHATADGRTVALTETLCALGTEGQLFGLHVQADAEVGVSNSTRPMVVLFNSGTVHHVGPNRLYVMLARELAALGFPTVRCDLEGLGDSVQRGAGRENHPYPDSAVPDAQQVLHSLRERFGVREFVLMGLCSGAYTAFQTGLVEQAAQISELVLINPLTWRWVEGDAVDTKHFSAVAHYKGTMRRLDSWKKLLRGQVNLVYLAGVVLSHLRKQVASRVSAITELLFPSRGPLLSRQLRQLFAAKRHVTLIVSSGDPGWDMLQDGARQTARRAIKNGDLALEFIDEADHTFSREAARRRVVAAIGRRLTARSG
ncbi:alpha/beta fold hydrolase [Rhizobacter sp. OV335]|uniref:alpha/beta fold hydrolase n=1 Tax=Rhizobacter sp. OV335 TaxID=1500264 RepID=UPI000923FBA4|nr:alpha/beta fold hydrolase [Rhizobacter sp. OV335]SHM40004.1 Lysophospholipase, alpha-beta hydrolase superfamily [Rhizobacter sp. OV335]